MREDVEDTHGATESCARPYQSASDRVARVLAAINTLFRFELAALCRPRYRLDLDRYGEYRYFQKMNDLNVLDLSARVPSVALVGLLLLWMTPGERLLAAEEEIEAQPWSQWRGPSRDGSVSGTDWPDNLDGLERVWRVELGEGYSGPIVCGDKVFVVETVDDAKEVVRALERTTGRELWRTSWVASGSVPFFAKKNGEWVRSTPAHDGEALYVGGMEEVLVKLDIETGEQVWKVDFPARFGTKVPAFGFASSPLLVEDALYVQAANSLVKVDRKTGDTIWRALESPPGMKSSGAYSSPIAATILGRSQIVVQTRYTLHGVDPASGSVLWSHDVPNFRGMNILTPVVHGDNVFTSSYRNRTYSYRITDEEGAGDDRAELSASEQWSNKVHGYMSTPVVIDGHAYLHLGNGRLSCVDLATGVERWISKPFGDYWSMVVQGDKVLALDAAGEIHLLRANPDELELLGSREIAQQSTWGHLAVSGDELFVRELNAIAGYEWSDPAAASDLGSPGASDFDNAVPAR